MIVIIIAVRFKVVIDERDEDSGCTCVGQYSIRKILHMHHCMKPQLMININIYSINHLIMRLYPTLTTSHTIPPSIVNQLAPTTYGAMTRKGRKGEYFLSKDTLLELMYISMLH